MESPSSGDAASSRRARLPQLVLDGLRDRDERVRLPAPPADPPAEVAPGLPGHIARRAGPLGPQHDREAQPPPGPDRDIGVMLEHRDIRQIDRILREPSREVPHVEPGSPESQPRGRQPHDRQPARARGLPAGPDPRLDRHLLPLGQAQARHPRGEHRDLGPFGRQGRRPDSSRPSRRRRSAADTGASPGPASCAVVPWSNGSVAVRWLATQLSKVREVSGQR